MTKYKAWAYSEISEDYTYIGQDGSVDGAKRLCEEQAGAQLNWQADQSGWVAYRMNTESPEFKVSEAREG